MQPYFFPYIGYFQLMRAVDVFVYFDDVQYIDRGWLNRNRILVNRKPTWLTLPVQNASRTLPINERTYLLHEGVHAIKRKLQAAYGKLHTYSGICALLQCVLDFNDPNVAAFNSNLLTKVARALGIECKIVRSSDVGNPQGLRGEDRILDLCQRLGAHQYINAIGGTSLYHASHFRAKGLGLSFLRTTAAPQEGGEVPQYLSIIHELMHLEVAGVVRRLDSYELLEMQAEPNADHS